MDSQQHVAGTPCEPALPSLLTSTHKGKLGSSRTCSAAAARRTNSKRQRSSIRSASPKGVSDEIVEVPWGTKPSLVNPATLGGECRCIALEHAGALTSNKVTSLHGPFADEKVVPLTFRSHPGLAIVPLNEEPRRVGEWFVVELGIGSARDAVKVVFDGMHLARGTDGMVLVTAKDLARHANTVELSFREEARLILVQGLAHYSSSEYCFVIHDNGFLAPQPEPHLAIGFPKWLYWPTDVLQKYCEQRIFQSGGLKMISGADVQGFDLQEAKLNGASMECVNLSDAVLSKAHLSKVSLSRSNLEKANLEGALLNESTMEFVKFDCANLKATDLRLVRASNGQLRMANLENADLTNATFQWSNFDHACLRNASLENTNMNKSSFIGADLDGATCKRTGLIGTDFTNSSLQNVNFAGAILTGAALIGADLRGANFANANVDSVEFAGASWDPYPIGRQLRKSVSIRSSHIASMGTSSSSLEDPEDRVSCSDSISSNGISAQSPIMSRTRYSYNGYAYTGRQLVTCTEETMGDHLHEIEYASHILKETCQPVNFQTWVHIFDNFVMLSNLFEHVTCEKVKHVILDMFSDELLQHMALPNMLRDIQSSDKPPPEVIQAVNEMVATTKNKRFKYMEVLNREKVRIERIRHLQKRGFAVTVSAAVSFMISLGGFLANIILHEIIDEKQLAHLIYKSNSTDS